MTQVDELDPVPEAKSSASKLLIGLLVLVLIGAGFLAWKWWQAREAPPPPVPAPAEPVKPASPPAPTLALADGDALLKQIAAKLSPSPELGRWLLERDLIRRLTAATSMVADGKTPAPILGFLKPNAQFSVNKRKKQIFAAPKSYKRYDLVTRVVTSIDAAEAGKAYVQLRPYFDTAIAQIAKPGTSFDAVLHEAVGRLTQAPLPRTEPELKLKGAIYVYADPALEELSPAQKQLLRMGNANARAIQQWLTRFDQAIR